MFRKTLLSALLLLAAAACSKDDTRPGENPANAFLQMQVPGVYEDDKTLFGYDSDLHQYAFNTGRRTFRIQNTKQDRMLLCTLGADPQPGARMTVAVETRAIASFPSQEIEMEVLRRTDGKVWLWNPKQRIGLLIRME